MCVCVCGGDVSLRLRVCVWTSLIHVRCGHICGGVCKKFYPVKLLLSQILAQSRNRKYNKLRSKHSIFDATYLKNWYQKPQYTPFLHWCGCVCMGEIQCVWSLWAEMRANNSSLFSVAHFTLPWKKNGPPPHQLYLAFHSVSVFYPPHCSISLTTIAICRWSISLVLIQNNVNKPLATASPPHVHRYTQLNPAYTQLRSFVEFRCKMFYKKRRNAFSTKILSFLYKKILHYTRVPCVSTHCSCCLLSCHSRWMFSFARFLSLSYVVQTGNVLHRFHTYSRRLGCHPFSVNALSRVHKPTTTSAPL